MKIHPHHLNLLSAAVKSGLNKGLSGFIWMLKILVPISFFTLLLDYSGWLSQADFLLSPAMGLLGLPSAAALPLIVGLLTGIYGAIATMTVLPLAPNHMTLVAIFLLISHNMIQEGIIQGKSGINPFRATLIRLAASVITVIIVARLLPAGPEVAQALSEAALSGSGTFWPMLIHWGNDTAWLCLKIFAIIITLMVVLETMKAFNIIPHILRIIHPFLRVMGLDRQVGMLWLTAGMFGIAYGAAVIMEEARENVFEEAALTRLHISIGINHSMIEDPALFLPLGLSAFWLWVPRLIAAIIAVQLFSLWHRIRPDRPVGGLHGPAGADL
ncbi:iron transporter [Desulfonema ishimotonii]|uniref:Iron transporter n=1 Tax=Desulfonema ishimotonii TaxID=45657 RepID=A0A401G0Q6_9BACT|nr:nucleoside recognition domain-containing protein [Desulfonema ishimotonii]GBC62763.1 iron transporter [Desulfonema ishimotonii]